MKHTHKMQLILRGHGRSFSDGSWMTGGDGEVLQDTLDLAVWTVAKSTLRKHLVSLEKSDYEVIFEWAPLVRRYERHLAASKYIAAGGRKNLAKRVDKVKFPRRPPKIEIYVQSESAAPHSAGYVVEALLYDIFLIMNLTIPGSCNFYGSKLVVGGNDEEVSLSSNLFELSFLDAKKPGGPPVRTFTLDQVVAWFARVRVGLSQLPSSPVEKVLFALFHLAKLDGDPASVIWIFYALESLLQTRVGENFNLLVRRLKLLLNFGEEDAKILKRKLRDLYEIRSAIVHGGFEVPHPMNNDALDKRAATAFGDLLDRVDYGYALVVSALQMMIEKDWRELQFEEVVGGHAVR